MKRINLIILISLCSIVSSLQAEMSSDEIIDKVRQYLGGDEKLRAIQTLHYIGSFESISSNESGRIEIYLSRPMKQRVDVQTDKLHQVSVWNDYEGWITHTNKSTEQINLTFKNIDELKRGRAETWENLNFFSGIETMFGKVINKGLVKKDGRDAYLLVFRYDENIYYDRYFDPETFAIIATVTSDGEEVKELGEMIVNGIRFPRTVVRLKNGEIISTISFDQIYVNSELDPDLFEFPNLMPSSAE